MKFLEKDQGTEEKAYPTKAAKLLLFADQPFKLNDSKVEMKAWESVYKAHSRYSQHIRALEVQPFIEAAFRERVIPATIFNMLIGVAGALPGTHSRQLEMRGETGPSAAIPAALVQVCSFNCSLKHNDFACLFAVGPFIKVTANRADPGRATKQARGF